jgi:hypothetical protein
VKREPFLVVRIGPRLMNGMPENHLVAVFGEEDNRFQP